MQEKTKFVRVSEEFELSGVNYYTSVNSWTSVLMHILHHTTSKMTKVSYMDKQLQINVENVFSTFIGTQQLSTKCVRIDNRK